MRYFTNKQQQFPKFGQKFLLTYRAQSLLGKTFSDYVTKLQFNVLKRY